MLEVTETTTVVIEPVGPDRGRAGEVIVVASETTRRVVLDREAADYAVEGITIEPIPVPFQEELCE